MNAEEFKILLSKTIEERSGSLEFRPSGAHYYLALPPNILVLNKRTFRGSFEGLFVAVTHNFLSNTKDAKGKFKLPSYPADYPIYADLEIVDKQYGLHKQMIKNSYHLHKDDLHRGVSNGTLKTFGDAFKSGIMEGEYKMFEARETIGIMSRINGIHSVETSNPG